MPLVAAGVTGGLVTASALGTTGLMSYLARRLLLPERKHVDDVRIRHVEADRITLSATPESVVPGRYGVWLPGGHLRIGDILAATGTSVTRVLETVDEGEPRPGPGRWNGWYYARDPGRDLGVPYRDVLIDSDVGELPSWLIDPEPGGDAATPTTPTSLATRAKASHGTWAVLVHGRGGRRPECLRAVPVLRRLGLTCLIPSYRNDWEAPPSRDGRYSLGLSEWRDVEASVRYALDAGADDVVLFGWSMGGAACLQLLDRSSLADRVTHVVLDSPVIDWAHVIRHQAATYRLPTAAASTLTHLIGQRWARLLVGVHEPLDVAQANWEHRADELRHRLLIMHSDADDLVPIEPSAALAAARPDLVCWRPWTLARHTQEWNLDPARWEDDVASFLG